MTVSEKGIAGAGRSGVERGREKRTASWDKRTR